MANNNGLSFNPSWGIDNVVAQQTGWKGFSQTVPTTAQDYYNPSTSTSLQPFKWDNLPNPLAGITPKASSFNIDWSNSNTIFNLPSILRQEEERIKDPLGINKLLNWKEEDNYDYYLNRWNNGLEGLGEDERNAWDKVNASKIAGHDEAWQDRLWRNQQFVNAFGMERFNEMPDKDDRDNFYYDYVTKDAIVKRFGNNQNIGELLSLTPKGREELLKSDYKNDGQMRQSDNDADNKGWTDYSFRERWNALTSDVYKQGMEGLGAGSIAGSVLPGVGTGLGAAIGGASGVISGLLTSILHPEDAYSVNKAQRQADNDNILNKIAVADGDRMKEDSQDAISELTSRYYQAYAQGQVTDSEINKAFDDIALNGKKAITDELGNTQEYDYNGSNYYSAFKDSDEFSHFGTYDKLKYLAQSQVLGSKYGQSTAMRTLDQDMQKYVSDNQNGWDWAGNTLKNIGVGGLSNIMMKGVGLGAIAARVLYGEQGLANFLDGKDASGNGEDNTVFNAQYWNKVDQYNTLDPDAIAKADKNGGISIYNNVVTPGTENDFWSWNTLNEALRMSKFAWSDALINMGLGKIVKGATRLFGGIELAPGVLATESSALSKLTNKVGSFGVMGASSLGIDAAYGMQTYNEVLDKNNAKLDQIINQDTEAEVQRKINDPEEQKKLRQAIANENNRRKAQAGERGNWISVDEQKAYTDWVKNIRREVRKEQESAHAEDRQQARNDAANAYTVDATIEGIRMTGVNGIFKNYLFDKGTLNALRLNNPYVDVTTKNGLYALGKNATRKKTMQILGNNIWGGFHSNYFDDVTVGFAEGMGLQEYNNYLLQKYNPAAYGAVMDDYVTPFVAGMAGAVDAMESKRAFMDGAIGALGTVFTVSPNINRRTRKTWEKEAKEATKRGEKYSAPSWGENMFFTNPIIQAYTEARNATNLTENEINRVNQIIKDNGYSLDNMVETMSALNKAAIARQGTSVMEAEDAKDREAFTLASSLLSLKNSGVVANAQAEPSKANWSKKRRIANAIGNGLNRMLGINTFEDAESQYTRAMQTLNDASTLGENADGATLQRQQELVKTFLGLDSNKNAIDGMSEEEQTNFAVERLKKNAQGLLETMDKTEKIQKKFENSIEARLHPDLKQQLIYQYVLDGRWKNRLSELEGNISGEQVEADDVESMIANRRKQNNRVIARYGSMQGFERFKKAQEKRVGEAQEVYNKTHLEAQKENDPTKSEWQNMLEKASRYGRERAAKRNLKKQKSALKELNKDEKALKAALDLNSTNTVVSAEDILKLDADDRLRMLNDYYRDDYSVGQQAEIDRAKNLLMKDGKTLNEAMEQVRDAAILTHRIEDNMEAARRIMNNPAQANMMQQALEENRKKKVIDYFNDKVVGDAFNDFLRDPEATLNQDNVVKKAREYSSAVLNGLQKMATEQLKSVKRDTGLSDKTLQDIIDGTNTVLNERGQRMNDNADLERFIRKTKSIDHTETISEPVMGQVVDMATGQTTMQPTGETVEREETTQHELSDNDRRLMEYALDYAAERDIPLENLADRVTTDDFDKYVEERNHSPYMAINPFSGQTEEVIGDTENMANNVDRDYMKNLVNDAVAAFNKHKETSKKTTEAKPVSTPKSVATAPVETKGSKDEGNDSRPDDVKASDDLFGLKGKKEAPKPKEEKKEGEGEKPNTYENGGIIETSMTLNDNISDDLSELLNEIGRRNMPDKTRNKLKEIVNSLVGSKHYDNIQALQNDIFAEAVTINQKEYPKIGSIATALTGFNVTKSRESRQGEGSIESKKTGEDVIKTSPLLTPLSTHLETLDLDVILGNPKFAPLSDYAKTHGMVNFIQKLSEVWKDNLAKHGKLHQAQVVFLYDPELARQVQESIEKNPNATYVASESAPLVMAIEISDKTGTKALVDDESQLIALRDVADNKTMRYYQPLGFMPANDNSHMAETSDRMSALRDCIEYDNNGVQILRYASKSGKHNGSVIASNLTDVQSHTEDEQRPFSTEDTPRKGVQQLMDENADSPTETFVKTTDEEKDEYAKAKATGNLSKIRETKLYKKLREAFIKRLSKATKEASNPEDPDVKVLQFKLLKGTHDSYPKTVLTKKIGESVDRNTGRPIVDMLRDVDDSGDNATEVINSNSRFRRLFHSLQGLTLRGGLFNQDGSIAEIRASYDMALEEYASAVTKAISNNLNVVSINVDVRVEGNTLADKTVHIDVYSGSQEEGNRLSTLTMKYGGKPSEAEFASFIKDLILDKEGNVRPSPNSSTSELVKWQVNYEDANSATNKETAAKVKEAAFSNLRDLYDDGILEMQVTKLAYPVRSVSVNINNLMRSRLYPEVKAEPEKKNTVTEDKASTETVTKDGEKIDADTGIVESDGSRNGAASGVLSKVLNTITTMIARSEQRNFDDKGSHYVINGQLYSRVTSIKYALEGMGKRLNPDNGWLFPASHIGNSADEFARDVFNGIFDSMTDEQRATEFSNYTNSTEKNYAKVYKDLKAFQARLAANGQKIIATGTRDNPGKITAAGMLNVTFKDNDSKVKTTQIRIAGTIDAIAVDSDGNIHLYDFKTHRADTFDKADAIKNGYDRQLSMYAKFLENEYGVKVASINIIPIKVDYPTPSGMDNDGHPIKGAQKTYRQQRVGSNQLEYKDITADDSKFVPYNNANFKVEKEFELPRLDDSKLIASYDKMTDIEKESLAEAIQQQEEHPVEEAPKEENIITVTPEGTDNTTSSDVVDEEAGGFGFDDNFSLFDDDASESGIDISTEGTADSIDNTQGLKKDMKDHEEACRNPEP